MRFVLLSAAVLLGGCHLLFPYDHASTFFDGPDGPDRGSLDGPDRDSLDRPGGGDAAADLGPSGKELGANLCSPKESYGNHGYWVCSALRTWSEATQACAAHGPGVTLVRINDPAENTFLTSKALSLGKITTIRDHQDRVWMGANDLVTEGEWFWVDGVQFWTGGFGGQTIGYSAFANRQPDDGAPSYNEDCLDLLVVKSGSPGVWNDENCVWPLPFICEGP